MIIKFAATRAPLSPIAVSPRERRCGASLPTLATLAMTLWSGHFAGTHSPHFCAVLRSFAQVHQAVFSFAQFKLGETADPSSNMEGVFQGAHTQRKTTSHVEH